jgi:hypothetical protein
MTGRSGGTVHAMRPEQCLIEMDALASGRSIPMLRKTMIVLATAAALTGGLTADAFARGGGGGGHMGGGGGHMGGGFGGAHMGGGHMGGGFGGAHMGGGFRPGQHFAGARGRFGFGAGDYGLYDFACDYGSPYYNPYTGTCNLY